jgi:hypothetical protein
MCDKINPELRKRMIREMAVEIRKWFRDWRRGSTVSGDADLQQTGAKSTDSLPAVR